MCLSFLIGFEHLTEYKSIMQFRVRQNFEETNNHYFLFPFLNEYTSFLTLNGWLQPVVKNLRKMLQISWMRWLHKWGLLSFRKNGQPPGHKQKIVNIWKKHNLIFHRIFRSKFRNFGKFIRFFVFGGRKNWHHHRIEKRGEVLFYWGVFRRGGTELMEKKRFQFDSDFCRLTVGFVVTHNIWFCTQADIDKRSPTTTNRGGGFFLSATERRRPNF